MKTLNELKLEAKNKEDEQVKHAFGLLNSDYRREFYKKMIEEETFIDYMKAEGKKEIIRGRIGKGKQFETVEDYENGIIDFIKGKENESLRKPKGVEREVRGDNESNTGENEGVLSPEPGDKAGV